ncbi:MAG TPA: helix-turn-helix domain-containing protein [Natronosporangium sp.]
MIFRTDDVPAPARVDYWEQALEQVPFPLEGRPREPAEFRASLRTGQLGPLRIIESSTPAGECRRTRRAIRRSNPDLHQVGLVVRGSVVVEQAGRQARFGPGDLVLVDHRRPARFVHPAVRHVEVAFPTSLLPLPPATPLRLPGTGPAALAASLARELPRQLDQLRPDQAVRVGQTFVDLLWMAVASQLGEPARVPPDARRRALLARVYAFIEAHLADPSLSPRSIAAAHHLSVRTLHKLFEPEPMTVAGWIRWRRLERSRRDLLDPALRDRPVSAIAARWGIANPAQFSRAFRAAYGCPPADYRRTGGSGAPTSSGVSRLDTSFSAAARLSSS